MGILNVLEQMAVQLILFLYFAITITAFVVITIQAVESLPRLKRALFLTINSLACVAVKRSWAYFCNQRFIDLGRTVPNTLILFCGSAASLSLSLCQNEIPFDSQVVIVFGALWCILIRYIFEVCSDSRLALPKKITF